MTIEHFLIAAATVVAGLVRGFAGFGAAMIFMPVTAAIRSPEYALVLLFLIGLPAQIPFVAAAWRRCAWREVVPLAVGATVMLPIGVALVLALPAGMIRAGISLLVLGFTITMAVGWRYTKRPSVTQTVGIGGAAGLAGGLAGLYGPTVVLFWLGGQNAGALVRANLFAFFGVVSLVEAATFTANGMVTRELLRHALWLLPLYLGAMWAGAHGFGLVPERAFRYIALSLCAAAALIGLTGLV